MSFPIATFRAALTLLPALVLLLAGGTTAGAADFLGGKGCIKCHKPLAKTSLVLHETRTLDNLSAPKAAEFAKATGGNAKDARCLKCHAPIAKSKAIPGPNAVSCEHCHGAGSEYLEPHQEDAFYAGAPAGMLDMYNKAAVIAKLCIECHVLNTTDKDIAATGHPRGDKFDAAVNLKKMKHWPSAETEPPLKRVRAYNDAFYGQVQAAAAPIQKTRLAALGPPAAGGGAAAAPAKPAAGGAAPPAAGGAAPAPAPGAQETCNTAASDSEYRELCDTDFTAPAPKPAGGARAPVQIAPDAPTGDYRGDAPSVRVVAAPAPAPPAAGAAPAKPGAAAAPATPAGTVDTKPRSVAELRGRAALVLANMLQKKAKIAPGPVAPPAEIGDELLSLQDEAIALALETLRNSEGTPNK